MTGKNTSEIEDHYMAPFSAKQRVSIESGKGTHVWDEEGNQYVDFGRKPGPQGRVRVNGLCLRSLCVEREA